LHATPSLSSDPEAIKLYATRFLVDTPSDKDEDFIHSLKTANEELVAATRASWDPHRKNKHLAASTDADGVARAYAAFVEEWCSKDELDDNLVRHLLKPPFHVHTFGYFCDTLFYFRFSSEQRTDGYDAKRRAGFCRLMRRRPNSVRRAPLSLATLRFSHFRIGILTTPFSCV
jgi:hypothetical protein